MKNIKDYIVGFADGFGKTSLQIPYFYCSLQKEDVKIKEKVFLNYESKGFKLGTNLGFLAISFNMYIYILLANNGHPEYFTIPIGTNILTYLYEKFKKKKD